MGLVYNKFGDNMSECDKNCSMCKTDCSNKCPICKSNSTYVPLETVKSILKDTSELIEEDIYVCLNRKCEVTYFNTKQYYVKEELKVPIWFKQNPTDSIVCYCYDITFEMIKEAVEKGCQTKEDVIKYYKMENKKEDCIYYNPVGKNCNTLFENVISYLKGVKK